MLIQYDPRELGSYSIVHGFFRSSLVDGSDDERRGMWRRLYRQLEREAEVLRGRNSYLAAITEREAANFRVSDGTLRQVPGGPPFIDVSRDMHSGALLDRSIEIYWDLVGLSVPMFPIDLWSTPVVG